MHCVDLNVSDVVVRGTMQLNSRRRKTGNWICSEWLDRVYWTHGSQHVNERNVHVTRSFSIQTIFATKNYERHSHFGWPMGVRNHLAAQGRIRDESNDVERAFLLAFLLMRPLSKLNYYRIPCAMSWESHLQTGTLCGRYELCRVHFDDKS